MTKEEQDFADKCWLAWMGLTEPIRPRAVEDEKIGSRIVSEVIFGTKPFDLEN